MTFKRRFKLTEQQRNDMWGRWKAGQSLHEIGRAFSKDHVSIQFMLAEHGGITPVARRRSPLTLTLADRKNISRGIASGGSIREIAKGLQRAVSTVSREVTRHGGRPLYRATEADQQAWDSALRPKRCSPGCLANHWCSKGHLVFVVARDLTIEHEDGQRYVLGPTMSYHVSGDSMSPHRVLSTNSRLYPTTVLLQHHPGKDSFADGIFRAVRGAGTNQLPIRVHGRNIRPDNAQVPHCAYRRYDTGKFELNVRRYKVFWQFRHS
jgi:hypothetical protein